jgi:hypothetical protein
MIALATGLAGCMGGEADFALPAGAPANAECRAVATERAEKSAAAEFNNDTQLAVFGRTYADCTAWYLKQSRPEQPPPQGGGEAQ